MATAPTHINDVDTPEATPDRGEKRVIVADTLGYCWGVRRAVDMVTDAATSDNPIAPIGDIIHNPQVVKRLRGQGVEGAESVATAKERGFNRVAITAHGMGPHLAQEAEEQNMQLVDTTCPLVTKVQRLGQKLVRQGYFLVVYGDDYHPEVKSVLGWAATNKSVAAKKISDLPWNVPRGHEGGGEGDVEPPRKVALVSQTTKNIDELMAFSTELQAMVTPNGGEFRLCNTICEPTTERQSALKRMVGEADLVLAIGGKKSSNTARLADVGNQMGTESYHIEATADIQADWLDRATVVGITAGASTPDDVIEEVVTYLADQGFAPPEDGIHPVDPDYVPAF